MSEKRPNALSDAELDSLFSAARAAPESVADDAEVSPALLAAILEDAERLQPGVPVASDRRSLLADLRDALGGWAGFGGLIAASAAGVMIGVGTPDLISDMSGYFLGAEAYLDASSGFDTLLEEG